MKQKDEFSHLYSVANRSNWYPEWNFDSEIHSWSSLCKVKQQSKPDFWIDFAQNYCGPYCNQTLTIRCILSWSFSSLHHQSLSFRRSNSGDWQAERKPDCWCPVCWWGYAGQTCFSHLQKVCLSWFWLVRSQWRIYQWAILSMLTKNNIWLTWIALCSPRAQQILMLSGKYRLSKWPKMPFSDPILLAAAKK